MEQNTILFGTIILFLASVVCFAYMFVGLFLNTHSLIIIFSILGGLFGSVSLVGIAFFCIKGCKERYDEDERKLII